MDWWCRIGIDCYGNPIEFNYTTPQRIKTKIKSSIKAYTAKNALDGSAGVQRQPEDTKPDYIEVVTTEDQDGINTDQFGQEEQEQEQYQEQQDQDQGISEDKKK